MLPPAQTGPFLHDHFLLWVNAFVVVKCRVCPEAALLFHIEGCLVYNFVCISHALILQRSDQQHPLLPTSGYLPSLHQDIADLKEMSCEETGGIT